MAYVTGGALAAAVSRAGGLGIVGRGYAGTVGGEPDLETELAQANSGKFGVGFITWALERAPKMLTKALQYSPVCVFLSFGDPSPFAAGITKVGAVLICQQLGTNSLSPCGFEERKEPERRRPGSINWNAIYCLRFTPAPP